MSAPAIRPVTGVARGPRPASRARTAAGLPRHYPPRGDRARLVRIRPPAAPIIVTGASAPAPAWPGRVGDKLREWGRRYLLAEVVGTLSALVAAVSVYTATRSLAPAALAASLAESAGFYAVVLGRTLPPLYRLHAGLSHGRRLWRTGRLGLAEASDFVVAELADTLLLRPGLIFLAAHWAGQDMLVGLVVGKLLADLGFYAVVIPSYELRKKLAAR